MASRRHSKRRSRARAKPETVDPRFSWGNWRDNRVVELIAGGIPAPMAVEFAHDETRGRQRVADTYGQLSTAAAELVFIPNEGGGGRYFLLGFNPR